MNERRESALRLPTALVITCSLFCSFAPLRADEPLTEPESPPDKVAEMRALATEFFEWRRSQQPVGGDDIPRVERPTGWAPDFSPSALESYRQRYQEFFNAVEKLDTSGWNVAAKVDTRLLRAAIQRVHWELEVLQAPQRNPLFYVQQTLGSVFELLIISSPMDDQRAREILLRLEHAPETLQAARSNLNRAVRPFAEIAIASLSDVELRLNQLEHALAPQFPAELRDRLGRAVAQSNRALQDYSAWLHANLDGMQTAFAIGPHAYQWFLTNVALIPNSPDELLAQGSQAWHRAVAWEVLEQNRNRDVPPLAVFETSERQIQASFLKENEIRAFLESRDLMTVPDWLMHYRHRQMPAHLEPLAFLGVTDDLTSETRLDEDAYSYIREPSDERATRAR